MSEVVRKLTESQERLRKFTLKMSRKVNSKQLFNLTADFEETIIEIECAILAYEQGDREDYLAFCDNALKMIKDMKIRWK